MGTSPTDPPTAAPTDVVIPIDTSEKIASVREELVEEDGQSEFRLSQLGLQRQRGTSRRRLTERHWQDRR